jgi:hypothetical protein
MSKSQRNKAALALFGTIGVVLILAALLTVASVGDSPSVSWDQPTTVHVSVNPGLDDVGAVSEGVNRPAGVPSKFFKGSKVDWMPDDGLRIDSRIIAENGNNHVTVILLRFRPPEVPIAGVSAYVIGPEGSEYGRFNVTDGAVTINTDGQGIGLPEGPPLVVAYEFEGVWGGSEAWRTGKLLIPPERLVR